MPCTMFLVERERGEGGITMYNVTGRERGGGGTYHVQCVRFKLRRLLYGCRIVGN